jgi:regulator of protease activity HflC (stomatin/prohibitin superfamily)
VPGSEGAYPQSFFVCGFFSQIDPRQDVQETMKKVVKAENEKIAAVDYATATETQADGQRRAEIKKAEGIKQV